MSTDAYDMSTGSVLRRLGLTQDECIPTDTAHQPPLLLVTPSFW